MKVVQINTECGRGSTGKIVVAISDLLSSKGIENYIFYSGNHKSDYKNGIQINSKFDLRLHQACSRLLGDQGWHSYLATYKLINSLKTIKPDIIHLHNLHGYYLNISLLFGYLRTCGAKVVWTFHDCWPITGHCTHFINVDCNKWITQCCDCPNIGQYPYSLFFDRSRSLYNRKKKLFTNIQNLSIVCPSNWLANIVRESFLKKNELKVIPNGVNLEVFKYTNSDLRIMHHCEDKFIILGVSSVWNNSKGLDVFCELASRLDSTYQIILVGTNNKIDSVLPSNIISIHKTQNQEELAEYYSIADLFLNPTRADNYPTVNLEAITCGTPVMTFNTGGSPESAGMIDDMIIKSNTVEETVAKIQRFAMNRDKYRDRYTSLRIEYDERKCYEKYLELYSSINGEG